MDYQGLKVFVCCEGVWIGEELKERSRGAEAKKKKRSLGMLKVFGGMSSG